MSKTLCAVPITLADANRFVQVIHRHNGRLPSAKFAIAATDGTTGEVHGVAIAGIPKARLLDDGQTLELNRICSDGTYNCCSFLYGACTRAAKAIGYHSVITYTQADEPGTSLKASGWTCEGSAGGGTWFRPNSNRLSKCDGAAKQRWRITLRDPLPKIIWPSWFDENEPPALFELG